MDPNAVFHQEHHELFPIHQGDGGLVGLGSFLDGSWTEVACGDENGGAAGIEFSGNSYVVYRCCYLECVIYRQKYRQNIFLLLIN